MRDCATVEPFVYQQARSRIVFGSGSLARLAEEVDGVGGKRVCIVASRSASHPAERAEALLEGRFAGRIGEVAAHVPAERASAAAGQAGDAGADCVVAIGGGSGIGLAKAIALHNDVSIVAVPTTYSGSEMTPIYGITSEKTKRTGRDARVQPEVVIYDASLTVGLPRRATAGTGMNAIAHCVEALWASDASRYTTLIASEAARALMSGLPRSTSEPDDLYARSEALYGSWLAGMALAAVTMGLHHRACHVLGGTFGLAHGDANAVLLPHVVAFNEEGSRAELSGVLGSTEPGRALYDFARDIGAPASLAELGMERDDVERAANLIAESTPPNPRPVNAESIRLILTRAWEGDRP